MKRKTATRNLHRIKLIAIIVLVAGIMLNATVVMTPTSVKEFDMYLTVGNYTGFNIDTSALFFGTISPGGWGTRSMTVENSGNETTRVEFHPSGNISVTFSENNFNLGPGENRNVSVTASVPLDMPYANYTGKLIIQYFR